MTNDPTNYIRNPILMKAFSVTAFVTIGSVILNKICLDATTSPFPFPLTITWFQFVLTGAFLMLLQFANDRFALKWIPKADLPSTTSFWTTSVAAIYCAMVTTSNLCLSSIEFNFFPVIKTLHVCFIVAFACCCFSEAPPVKAVLAAIGILIGWYFVILGEYLGEFSIDGLLWGAISSGFVALYQYISKQGTKTGLEQDIHKWNLLVNNVSISIIVLAPVVVVSSEWPAALDALKNLNSKFGWLIVCSGFVGFVRSCLAIFSSGSNLSVIASKALKATAVIVFGVVYFGNRVTSLGSIGSAVCLIGVAVYYFAQNRNDKQEYSNQILLELPSEAKNQRRSSFAVAGLFIGVTMLTAFPGIFPVFQIQNADTTGKLSIITPCFDLNNLQEIGQSIDWGLTHEWILAFDATTISLEQIRNATHPKHHRTAYLPVELKQGKNGDFFEGEMRNQALQVATGDWIYFLDGDNLMHPSFWPFFQQVISNGTKNIVFSFDQEEMPSGSPSLRAASNIIRRAPWKNIDNVDQKFSKQSMEEEADKTMFLLPRLQMLPLASNPEIDTIAFIANLVENSNENAHAYFHQVHAYWKYFAPDLSVVTVGHHDGLNEEAFGSRVNLFVGSLAVLAARYKIKLEIVFTGASPSLLARLDSNHVLRELDQRVDIYTTPPGTNEFAAKNAGVRRTKGKFVIVCSPDLIFTPGMFEFISKNYLEKGKFYVAIRAEVSEEGKQLTSVKSFERLMSRCQNTMYEAPLPPGAIDGLVNLRIGFQYYWSNTQKFVENPNPFFDTAGDFVMMHRDDWRLVRGYSEKEGLNGRLDVNLLKLAALSGMQQRILALHRCVFHIAHAKVGEAEEVNVENPAELRNGLNWGLENFKLPHASVPH